MSCCCRWRRCWCHDAGYGDNAGGYDGYDDDDRGDGDGYGDVGDGGDGYVDRDNGDNAGVW